MCLNRQRCDLDAISEFHLCKSEFVFSYCIEREHQKDEPHSAVTSGQKCDDRDVEKVMAIRKGCAHQKKSHIETILLMFVVSGKE